MERYSMWRNMMMGDGIRTVSAEELTDLAVTVLRAAKTPPAVADAVAGSLVESNLVGHDSHGVRRLSQYVAAIHEGRIVPDAVPVVDGTSGTVATVRGMRAFGQLAAGSASNEVRKLAHEHGVGVAVVRECNHVGRLGEYVADLAADDLVALALSNADPTVAPFGGRVRKLGTNPMAWGIPRERDTAPLVMDWATAAVAEGKLAQARDLGEEIRPGLVVDRFGEEAVQPDAFYDGGALLPFGGHKGYGLSLVIEILGGLLSGAGLGSRPDYDGGFGTFIAAFRLSAFTAVEAFRAEVEQFCQEICASPPAPGHDAVRVPGELETRTKQHRAVHGVPLPAEVWQRLLNLRSGP